ncbi:DUF6230 family protein [Streptomyces sp. NPDC052301]|uniref:DUF6230 family protein n=1 Tax=Streptomyces sp. NPDC052301 TaxID=3365687 RepID=UPI0037D88D05
MPTSPSGPVTPERASAREHCVARRAEQQVRHPDGGPGVQPIATTGSLGSVTGQRRTIRFVQVEAADAMTEGDGMSPRVGKTCWRRFVTVLVPSVAACAALGIAMGQGVLAASFLISGKKFQVTADTLTARGFSVYSMVDVTRQGERVPVMVTGARHSTISALCQSVLVEVPVLGEQTVKLTGGDERPVEASNLFLDTTSQSAGQADFSGLDQGIAQGEITKGPINPGDRNSRFFDPDGFGQQATSVVLTDVRVTAVALSAGTFNIPGLRVQLEHGRHECF